MHTYVPPFFPTTPTSAQAFTNVSTTNRCTHRIAKPHMPHDTVAEERPHAPKRAIDELIRHHKIRRLMFFFQSFRQR